MRKIKKLGILILAIGLIATIMPIYASSVNISSDRGVDIILAENKEDLLGVEETPEDVTNNPNSGEILELIDNGAEVETANEIFVIEFNNESNPDLEADLQSSGNNEYTIQVSCDETEYDATDNMKLFISVDGSANIDMIYETDNEITVDCNRGGGGPPDEPPR